MQSTQPDACRPRPIPSRPSHELDASVGLAQVAGHLIDMGILSSEWRPKLLAFGEGGWLLAREISRISGVEAAFVAVAELAPAWPGGPVFAAAAFDNTVIVDDAMKEICAVSRNQFHKLVEAAYQQVSEIARRHGAETTSPDLCKRTAILIDDGLSTLLATRAAIAAMRNGGAQRVVFVAPAAARRNMQQLADEIDLSYCGTQRSGRLASPQRR